MRIGSEGGLTVVIAGLKAVGEGKSSNAATPADAHDFEAWERRIAVS